MFESKTIINILLKDEVIEVEYETLQNMLDCCYCDFNNWSKLNFENLIEALYGVGNDCINQSSSDKSIQS
jgi:hypothetical protein